MNKYWSRLCRLIEFLKHGVGLWRRVQDIVVHAGEDYVSFSYKAIHPISSYPTRA